MAVQQPKDEERILPTANKPGVSTIDFLEGHDQVGVTYFDDSPLPPQKSKSRGRSHKSSSKKLVTSKKINIKSTPAPKGPAQSLAVDDGVLQESETQTTALKPGPPKESIKSQPGLLEQIVGDGNIPRQRQGIPELYVEPGYYARNYMAALSIVEDPNESIGNRLTFLAAGAGVALPWAAEESLRAIVNIPYFITYAGDNLVGAVQANDWFSATIYGLGALEGVGEVSNGLMSAGVGSWPTPSRGSISTRSLSPELDIGFPGNAEPRLGWTGNKNPGAGGLPDPGYIGPERQLPSGLPATSAEHAYSSHLNNHIEIPPSVGLEGQVVDIALGRQVGPNTTTRFLFPLVETLQTAFAM